MKKTIFEYVENGRMQTLEAAIEVDSSYKKLLDENDIEYQSIPSNIDVNIIIENIMSNL